MNQQQYECVNWETKLMAFLHDPPCKAFGLSTHEDRANSFRASAGIDEDKYAQFVKTSDWVASAADRFPFPEYSKSKLRAPFDGSEQNPFVHPLGGKPLVQKSPVPSETLAEEKFQQSIPDLSDSDFFTRFMLYWRRWPEESARHDERLAFLPADTRIPDHTIWNHMSITSALHACIDPEDEKLKPSFLLFSLGPVQDFISAARSTRDFLSGSYLLSWLSAHAMKAIADRIGPDSVIFPNLRGQPLFDSLYRESIYEKLIYKNRDGEREGGDTLWARMGYTSGQLLTPSLPNVFMALVPTWRAEELGQACEQAVRDELCAISEACWESFDQKIVQGIAGQSVESNWKQRWDAQVDRFPQLYWQATPWDLDKQEPAEDNLKRLWDLAYQKIQPDHRYPYKSPGFFWSEHYREATRWMAARKTLRDFAPFDTDPHQEGTPKDALTGKEEIVGSEELWQTIQAKSRQDDEEDELSLLKHKEGPYGAMTLIKRLWMRDDATAYLKRKLGLKELNLTIPSLPELAGKNRRKSKDSEKYSRYVAVLALDGDDMGKWISGEKLPDFLSQLAPPVKDYFMNKVSAFPEGVKRSVSPSFHLQFSEALANFSNHIARPVVEHFKGHLVYAGGDDVLALLPADNALACAYALRCCFRGDPPELLRESRILAEETGSLFSDLLAPDQDPAGWLRRADWENEAYPLMMPGPQADVSCGIAIGYEKHPLTSLIREAQAAEKRAKKHYQKGAFSISLLKHGGETVQWGSKWGEGDSFMPLSLYETYRTYRRDETVSNRFPYALADLLQPYQLEKESTGFNAEAVILQDLEQVLERQVSGDKEIEGKLRTLCEQYLNTLQDAGRDQKGNPCALYEDFAKLFLTAAFIERDRG